MIFVQGFKKHAQINKMKIPFLMVMVFFLSMLFSPNFGLSNMCNGKHRQKPSPSWVNKRSFDGDDLVVVASSKLSNPKYYNNALLNALSSLSVLIYSNINVEISNHETHLKTNNQEIFYKKSVSKKDVETSLTVKLVKVNEYWMDKYNCLFWVLLKLDKKTSEKIVDDLQSTSIVRLLVAEILNGNHSISENMIKINNALLTLDTIDLSNFNDHFQNEILFMQKKLLNLRDFFYDNKTNKIKVGDTKNDLFNLRSPEMLIGTGFFGEVFALKFGGYWVIIKQDLVDCIIEQKGFSTYKDIFVYPRNCEWHLINAKHYVIFF